MAEKECAVTCEEAHELGKRHYNDGYAALSRFQFQERYGGKVGYREYYAYVQGYRAAIAEAKPAEYKRLMRYVNSFVKQRERNDHSTRFAEFIAEYGVNESDIVHYAFCVGFSKGVRSEKNRRKREANQQKAVTK